MRTSARRPAFVRTVAGIAAAVVVTDVGTKQLAEQRLDASVDLVLGAHLSLSHNSGVAFGALASAPDGLVLATVAICVAVLGTALLRGWLPASGLAAGLLAGGALANVLDRAGDGRVTDFIAMPYWPAFNVADIAVTLGVVALVAGVARDRPSETGGSDLGHEVRAVSQPSARPRAD